MGFNSDSAELVIRVTGQGDATELMQKVNGLIDEARKKTEQATEETKGWKYAAEEVKGSWQMMATGLDSVLNLAGKIGSAISGIRDAIKDAAQEQAITSQFQRVFAQVEGGVENLGAKLAEATGGQLDDDKYMVLATKLKEAGASTAQITMILNTAVKAANAYGREVDATAESFVQSYTRGNERAFKQLGIVTDTKSVLEEHARLHGRNVSELTEAERRAVGFEAALKQAAKALEGVNIQDGAIARVNQLQVRWNDFTDSVKTGVMALADSGFWGDVGDNALDVVTLGVKPLVDSFHDVPVVSREVAQVLGQVTAELEKQRRAEQEAAAAVDQKAAAERAAKEAAQKHQEALEAQVRAAAEAIPKEIQLNQALAEKARQMGYVAQASQYAAKAQELLTQSTKVAHLTLTDQLKEMKRSFEAAEILMWASPLQASKNPADVAAWINWRNDIERSKQLEGVQDYGSAMEEYSTAAAKKKGGGGRKTGPTVSGELIQNQLAFRQSVQDFESARAYGQKMAEDYQKSEEERLASERQYREQYERDYEAFYADLADQMGKNKQEAVEGLAALDNAAQSLTESMSALASVGATKLSGFLGAVQNNVLPTVAAFQKAQEAGLGWGESFAAAAPGVITAIGSMGAAWFDDARVRYGILAVAEGAAAAASFPNVPLMISHGAAAVGYTAAAIMAGGAASPAPSVGAGGGTGLSAGQVPSGFSTPPSMMQGYGNITINVQGLATDDPATLRKIGRGIQRELTSVGTWGRA